MGIFETLKKDRKQNNDANLNEKIELATSNINKGLQVTQILLLMLMKI